MRHLGYAMSGAMHVVMDDGQALDIGPDEVFDIPPGHDKWVVGDEPWVTIEWGGSGARCSPALHDSPGRMLATVVFTDIVDSTARLRELGDGPWRDLLSTHNGRMREQLNVFRGREVKTTGDGLLAVFDSPTRAVRCAATMVDASRAMGVAIRVGVHTGEVELVGDDVRGIAVHVAARVLALAGAGRGVADDDDRRLVEGSGLRLEDAGTHELKGLPGAASCGGPPRSTPAAPAARRAGSGCSRAAPRCSPSVHCSGRTAGSLAGRADQRRTGRITGCPGRPACSPADEPLQ